MTNTEKMLTLLAHIVVADDDGPDRNTAIGELKSMLNEQKQNRVRENVGHEIDRLLLEVGVPCHLIGYENAKKSIALLVETPNLRHTITKGLYPLVADAWDIKTTPSRVERSIRHAVCSAWDRGDIDVLHKYFGNTVCANKGKPTNAEFLCTMANEIQRRMS